MINAEEVFTMQLARAAGKIANRFLHARGLQKADRDDVIMEALGWCWAHRAQYSLTTTLETWFMNAVRDAYKTLQRGELPTSVESMESFGGADETYNIAEAESAARALIDALTPAHKEVAVLTMHGYTREEMIGRGIPERTVNEARRRIKQLGRLLPDTDGARLIARTLPATLSDDVESAPAEIDIEIARLDFAPHAGKDCPPCFRCMWFEGFMPSGKLDTRLEIVDVEVRAAVKDTEARKIEIAQQVRDGK